MHLNRRIQIIKRENLKLVTLKGNLVISTLLIIGPPTSSTNLVNVMSSQILQLLTINSCGNLEAKLPQYLLICESWALNISGISKAFLKKRAHSSSLNTLISQKDCTYVVCIYGAISRVMCLLEMVIREHNKGCKLVRLVFIWWK
jgi:hypothetical protein